MALSNWDTIAWNTEGKPIVGTMEFPDKTGIEIYKNWINVLDPTAHRKGDPIIVPYVITFNSGDLSYRRIHLLGKRSVQNSIFVVAIYSDYREKPKIELVFYGIGVYGYKNEKWVGVEPRTVELYMKWLKELVDNYSISGIPILETGIRYNQGDALFAEELGFEIPTTEVGKAKSTILSRILGKPDAEKET